MNKSLYRPLVALCCFLGLLGAAAGRVQAQTVNCAAGVCTITPGADCVANGNALRNTIDALITAGTGGTINLGAGIYCLDRPWRLDGIGSDAFTGTRTISGVSISIIGPNRATTVIRRQPAASLPVGVSPNFRLFNLESNGSLTLQGVSLENGQAGQGGAVRSVGGNQLVLRDSEVRDNNAFTRGGGLFVQNTGPGNTGAVTANFGLVIAGTNFFRNVAQNGFGGGASVERTDVSLTASVFSCNQALDLPGDGPDDADGGGLYFNNGGDPGAPTRLLFVESVGAARTVFTCNFAASEGGGAYVNGGTDRFVSAEPGPSVNDRKVPFNADFFGNRANFQGGGLYTQATSMEFRGCTFGGGSLAANCPGAGIPCTLPSAACIQVADAAECARNGGTPAGAPCVNGPCSGIGQPNQAARGGGVMNVTSDVVFRRCSFVSNRAVASGGGRAGGAGSSGGTNAYIECCFLNNISAEDFAGNSPANSRGGGSDAEFGSPLYNDCLFKGNEAAFGGGISISGPGKDTTTLIYNCQITQNVGSVGGGGVAVLGDASPRILHTTIARNRSARPGNPAPTTGAARFTAGTGVHANTTLSLPTVINSIITQNMRGPDLVNGSFSYGYPPAQTDVNFRGATAVRASFSFIDVGSNTAYPDTVPGGAANSNIKGCWKPATTGANFDDNDPSFESSGIDGMNVHLQCNSPCIDHANYALSRSMIQFLIGLGSVSPIPEARCTESNPRLRFLCRDGEEPPIANTGDPVEVGLFITRFLKDYDDPDENCSGLGTGQERATTCRPLQCQSDMGADEARTDIVINPLLNDKVVCVGGTQSFTATALCNPPSSPPIPIAFTWTRVDRATCVETPLAGVPGYTIVNTADGTSSTLTITSASLATDNAYFKVVVARGQYSCLGSPLGIPTVPLAPFVSCDPTAGCPLATSQARLYVVPPPAVTSTGDKSVCSNGLQSLEYTFSWSVLPTTAQPITCPPGNALPGVVPPVACNPTISYFYQSTPPATSTCPPAGTAFTGNARAAITCDPDSVGQPDANGIRRATRLCRIRFTRPQDCDSGRYAAMIDCGLPAGKCTSSCAYANLCVTPPPTTGGDTSPKTVCLGGNQTINLFADFPLPAPCATAWCPSPACTPRVVIKKKASTQGDADAVALFTYTSGQAQTSATVGNQTITCSPVNASRRLNCTVRIQNATRTANQCFDYGISADCANLSALDPAKCNVTPTYVGLCVLDPPSPGGDTIKYACRPITGTSCTSGNITQTLNLFADFPVPTDCAYCSANSCTPHVSVVKRPAGVSTPAQDTVLLNYTTFPAPANATVGTAAVACAPAAPGSRRINCTVTFTNPTDADCAQYVIRADCSNLPSAPPPIGPADNFKCTLVEWAAKLCITNPPTVNAGSNYRVCRDGRQTIPFTINFPASTAACRGVAGFCDNDPCTPDVHIYKVIGSTRYEILEQRPAAQPQRRVFKTCTPATVTSTNRTQNCVVTINNARVVDAAPANDDPDTRSDCAQYVIEASCALAAASKCGIACTTSTLCVQEPPTFGRQDPTINVDAKTVCLGNNQVITFRATFPASTCTLCSAADCTPRLRIVTGSCTGTDFPGVAGRVAVNIQNYDQTSRTITATLTFTGVTADDCRSYYAVADCSNITDPGKGCSACWETKLCVINPPTISTPPNQKVCVGGRQFWDYTVTCPSTTCTSCPTGLTLCTPQITFLRRTGTTGPATNAVIATLDASSQMLTATIGNATLVCSPLNCTAAPGGGSANCRVTITNAQLGAADVSNCADYGIRVGCTNFTDQSKCPAVDRYTQLCVLPLPTSGGDSTKCICYGGSQTLNLYGQFPVITCTDRCTDASCGGRVIITRTGSTDPVFTFSTTDLSARSTTLDAGRTTITCSPLNSSTRRINCTVTVTSATADDCRGYTLTPDCANITGSNKCNTTGWTANLCVRPPPQATAEVPQKYVCRGGNQTIRLFADFPSGSCNLCTGATCCPPGFRVEFRSTGGSIIPLNNGVLNPVLGATATWNTTPDASGRFTVNIAIAGATDSNCGNYCLVTDACTETVGTTTQTKCAASTACTRLCVLTPPTDTVPPAYCVCRGGCQTLTFRVHLSAPNCTLPTDPQLPACNLAACDPDILIYKRLPNNTRFVYPIVRGTGAPLVNQVVCDPTANASGDIFCRLRVGAGADTVVLPACPGASAADDADYCIEVACGVDRQKCNYSTPACTHLNVYEPPTPDPICDRKVCVGESFCVPVRFTAPPCCQSPVIDVRRNGAPVTLNNPPLPTDRIYLTGSGAATQLCFRNVTDADDGRYTVTVSCSDLTAEKGCSGSRCFCLDVLTPPSVTVDHDTRTACLESPVAFYFCVQGDTMNCTTRAPGDACAPVPPGTDCSTPGGPDCTPNLPLPPGSNAAPIFYTIEKIPSLMALPENPGVCGTEPGVAVTGTFTFGLAGASDQPTPACAPGTTTYKLNFPSLSADQVGIYRLKVRYCGLTSTQTPCMDCVYFQILPTGQLCLNTACFCPGENAYFCPRFVDTPGCNPDPYVARPHLYNYAQESQQTCADPRAACFDFQWQKAPPQPSEPDRNSPAWTDIPTSGAGSYPTATSCCIDLGTAVESDARQGYWFRLVARARTTPPCLRTPCTIYSPGVQFTICTDCCWCQDCMGLGDWYNGRPDNQNPNGVLSMRPAHGEFPELKAAADFYLPIGQYHKIKRFAGRMKIRQNPALPYKAKLTLYEDCDGEPGAVIRMWNLEACPPLGTPDATGLRPVSYEIDFTDADKLWLAGGRSYWWSLQGVSDFNTPNYEAYWVTSAQPILGSVPKKMEVGVDSGWRDLDECCIDCTELAFCVDYSSCKVIWDNGVPEPCATAGGTRSERSLSPARNSRAADNFVTPITTMNTDTATNPCPLVPADWMVCYIEGYIYTNCNITVNDDGSVTGFNTWLEIYGNDCNLPRWLLAEPPAPLYRFRADRVELVTPECVATIDDVPNLRLYKVKFCPMGGAAGDMGLLLAGGRDYWLSLSVEDTFAQGQRSYFAWSSDDCTPCPIKISPGRTLAPGRGINRWTEVGRDFAFLIAAKNVPFDVENRPPSIAGAPTCPPDVNRDGTVTVQDMFDFLQSWFAGCP